MDARTSRLDTEFHRLYALDDPGRLLDEGGRTRTLVLAWPAPVDWEALGTVWRAVQQDLGWPAPAIAVSGEALQLWFSLAQPVPAEQAQALLTALRRRCPPAPGSRAVQGWPEAGQHAQRPGAALAEAERWSAFVSPDLAPLFAQTPWLDMPPGEDGQATLLAALGSVPPSALQALLGQAEDPASAAATTMADPRAFLQQVMADPEVPLALRIEAAKALLADRAG